MSILCSCGKAYLHRVFAEACEAANHGPAKPRPNRADAVAELINALPGVVVILPVVRVER